MLARIEKILSIDGHSIMCKWTNGDKRVIDFSKVVANYPAKIREKILDLEVLGTVELNQEAKTLLIRNVLSSNNGEIDFCPDVLFYNSELVS
ncbi:MAG: hypothetical protein H6567_12185 [Lewinellaceae bacterium]|nr:hypothetical protein [Lewinellaceae bacterium]